jgi:hypothetical protein
MYEAITIIKRANQINSEIKKRIDEKLEEFATYNDKTKNKLRFQNFMKNYLSHML